MKYNAAVQAVHKKAEGGKIVSQIQEMIKPAAAMLDTYPVVTTKQKNQTVDQDLRPGHDAGKGRALFLASGASCDGAVAGI